MKKDKLHTVNQLSVGMILQDVDGNLRTVLQITNKRVLLSHKNTIKRGNVWLKKDLIYKMPKDLIVN